MNLTDINKQTPLVREFNKALQKYLGESVISIVPQKAKRTDGISQLPMDFNLENGQVLTVFFRLVNQEPDIFSFKLNGSALPTAGDFDHNYKPAFNKSVKELASVISKKQAAFDKKRATVKVKQPRAKNSTISQQQQMKALTEQIELLEQQVNAKTQERDTLKAQLSAMQLDSMPLKKS